MIASQDKLDVDCRSRDTALNGTRKQQLGSIRAREPTLSGFFLWGPSVVMLASELRPTRGTVFPVVG